jgi:hypothetical protein
MQRWYKAKFIPICEDGGNQEPPLILEPMLTPLTTIPLSIVSAFKE